MDVSRSLAFIALVLAAPGCGGGPREAVQPVATPASLPRGPTAAAPPPAPDPDLHRPPPRKLLDIAWSKIDLTDDAAALAVWRQIAPRGADWQDKLEEIPATATRPLAIAVLRGGNFLCTPPATGDCARPAYEVDPPAETAGFDDPCLRRVLALWAIDQIEDDDVPAVRDALRGLAALPPPESQLVAAAIHAVPEAEQDLRLAVLAAAWRAGQRELVGAAIGSLDEPHQIAAVRDHHIDAALDALAAETHRAVYLAAVRDDGVRAAALGAAARIAAISELVATGGGAPRLPADLVAALTAAAKSRDCAVAAAAARALAQHGDPRFVPRRPRTANRDVLMRAVCVLASYEAAMQSDEPSLVPDYVPARGLVRTTIAFDPLSDDDPDGDGDPHTTHTAELVPRAEAVLPEIEDFLRALSHCTGTICVSDDHEFRLVWSPAGGRPGELLLSRIEIADRPPCPSKPAP